MSELTFGVTHQPGALRLDGFSLLVHAPGQWGPGIWLEDGKASVMDVGTEFASTPDHDAVARKFGTTAAHVRQAVAYLIVNQESAAIPSSGTPPGAAP